MDRTQFGVLYRQFLFRTIDQELLSASAQGDTSKLLGQFASLLVFVGTLLGLGGLLFNGGGMLATWRIVHFLISTTMLTVGLFAVLSWDSMFPDRRDVLVLAPLPIRPRTLFVAKVAAVATALGIAVGALHYLAGFTWPLSLGAPRSFAAYWITMFSAGAFVFCSLLTVQGAAALLGRQQFLRISAILQMIAFCLLLSVYFLQPSITTPEEIVSWLPTNWFLGLFESLNGTPHPALTPLAWRAAAGLALAVAGTGASFLLAYPHVVRKIVEAPDIAPRAHGARWLPRFGDGPVNAVVQFSIRTLFRSRQHRLILAFFFGLAFAMAILYSRTPLARRTPAAIVNTPLLVSSVVVMWLAVVGTRVVFAIPVDLRANWIFQLAGVRQLPDYLKATRRSLFVLSVAPVLMLWAGLLFSLWPAQPAAVHLALLGLLGALLVELCLDDYYKIPFTCSYLPGKANIYHLFFAYTLLLIPVLHWTVDLERQALQRPAHCAVMILVLGVPVISLRLWTSVRSQADGASLRFEEMASPSVQELRLRGD